jgi:hypothetical protein
MWRGLVFLFLGNAIGALLSIALFSITFVSFPLLLDRDVDFVTTIAYNSCRNRHCPKCQGAAARAWLAEREAELLPVPYFHVVFTLPTAIADIAYQNKAMIYDLLLRPRPRRCSRLRPIPSISAPASASLPCCTPGARP